MGTSHLPENVLSLMSDRSTQPLRWSDLAWPEVGAVFDANPSDVGLLPVGATEQHGPHLPSGTDTILATSICEAVSVRTHAMVLPPIAVGCSYGHGTHLPGTLSLTPEGLASVVQQTVEWASLSGLRRFLIVNAHFGNHAALMVATDHIRLQRPDLRVGLVGWWAADPEVAAETALDGEDIHANRTETSLMLATAPQLVNTDRLLSSDDPDRTAGLVFRYTATSLSTNGVTGRPSEASMELGKRLLARTVDAIAGMVERGRTEEPPLAGHIPRILPAAPVAPGGDGAHTIPEANR
jgi:creatinine amidohydrolase